MGRTLVIGDIHNCYRGLKQALERANVQPEDKLIFLGDYVDGWSEAKETLQLILTLKEFNECVFIAGNHDREWCQPWLQFGSFRWDWGPAGGKSTVNSLKPWIRDVAVRAKLLDFFTSQLNYYIDDQNRLFVHGGFIDERGVGHREKNNEYVYYWNRSLFEDTLNGKDTSKRRSNYKEIFIGHTPTLRPIGNDQPWNKYNLWNIDTGAAYYGRVTVMDVDTKYSWQSDPVRELYPNEKGRN